MKKARTIVPALLLLLLGGSSALGQGDGGAPKSFWLGERASNDPLPVRIDELFNLIMWICIVATVLVFSLLIYYLVKYREVPGRKAKFVHGNHKLEIVWTVIPAAILIWLGFTQVPTWNSAKVPSTFPKPEESTVVQIAAQQFDWNFRQPGLDGKFESYDAEKARAAFEEVKKNAEKPDATEEDKAALADFNTVSNKFFGHEDDDDIVSKTLTVPVNKPVLIELRSIDVIHSFFIPVMRLKQDAVPGKPMPVWFKPTKIGTWEIMCAQLCGNNHTTMRANIVVLSQADYDAWVKTESAKKAGGIDRAEGADNVWMHWFKQGVRPGPGGELTKPWNELKLAKQEALKGPHAEHK
jgi:cytochrome c oxidase subunit 2